MATITAPGQTYSEDTIEMIILDTDHFSFLEFPESRESIRLSARIAKVDPAEHVVVTVVTYEEQTRGRLAAVNAARNADERIMAYLLLRKQLQNYLRVRMVDFDAAAEAVAQELQRARVRIGTLDLRIAAIALSRGALVLSRNRRDFAKVPNLRIEDWTLPG
jgi:tRNA(fMet)-specific endonuclease VapC